ncbi:MAG: inner-rane translocator [Solirubrobacterales bacterium]|nr:inner-rane translocator [Solirubrobacterales bacterium]
MEAGTLGPGQERTMGERFAHALNRFSEAPYVVKAGIGIFLLDLVLVLADRRPDSVGEWVLLLAIFAATVAAMVPLERRPAATAAVVLANVVAILILYHGLHEVSQRGINGLSLGAIYALGAVGLTLVYGILKLVNFAHGDFLTFGAYMAYLVNVTWELPLVFGLAFAVLTTALLGIGLEKVMWGPMRGRGAGMLQLLLMAIGLAFVIRYGIQFVWGTELRQLNVNRTDTVNFLDLRVGRTQLIVIIVGFVTLIATGLMLRMTLLGKRMRALSDDLDLAETSGIDTSRVILYTWLFAAGLAGLAGVFAGAITQLQPELGFELLLPIFAAVVLGGIGNAFGALTAGIVLGVVIEWSTLIVAPGLKLAVGFVILIIVLIIRPEGIFGHARTV